MSSRTPSIYDLTNRASIKGPAFNFSEITLLVVDGTHSFRKMVARVLHRFGFQAVYEASNGEDALEIIRHHHVDIVMTEWSMSPIDGYQLIQKLRHNKAFANPERRIIMLTGLTEKSRVLAARDAGVDGFLRKPVSPDTLFKRIVGVIETPIGLANLEAAQEAAKQAEENTGDTATAPSSDAETQ